MTQKERLQLKWVKVGDRTLTRLHTEERPVYIAPMLKEVGVDVSEKNAEQISEYASGRMFIDMDAGHVESIIDHGWQKGAIADLPEDVWPQAQAILVNELGFSEEDVERLEDLGDVWPFDG